MNITFHHHSTLGRGPHKLGIGCDVWCTKTISFQQPLKAALLCLFFHLSSTSSSTRISTSFGWYRINKTTYLHGAIGFQRRHRFQKMSRSGGWSGSAGCGVEDKHDFVSKRLRLMFNLTCLTHKSRRKTELFGHRDNVEGERQSGRRLHATNVRPSAWRGTLIY